MELPSKEIYSVVLLGTSGVGKSTIAFYLEHGYPPPSSIKPTIAFGINHIVFEKELIGLIDVGGQRRFLDMRYHERFVRTADGLVFVIDSARKDFKHDEQWLDDALQLITKEIPILVIANKQDLQGALPPALLEEHFISFSLSNYTYKIFGTVASDPGGIRSGENIESAFLYLVKQIRMKRNFLLNQEQM
ncbi:MAG: ADP-ribosylation factor-like protein [Candidatus Hodarchaeales archaeon]|jgi:small GTP-binding protein